MKHQKEIDRPSRKSKVSPEQKDLFIERVRDVFWAYKVKLVNKEMGFDDIRDAFFELEKK